MAKKRIKIDPHMSPAWGARPLFRLQLNPSYDGHALIDVISITNIPNANKAFTNRFKKSKPVTGPTEPTMFHECETWHCLCLMSNLTWSYMSFTGEELDNMRLYDYEVVS